MNKLIIYQLKEGGVMILTPLECGLTLEQIAEKDVPTGSPYKIVDASDVPTDETYRGLWTVDVTDLTDGVGK
jgi:hypothetical protein|tara:strand:+ start:500 stop:715 length:216 start_codon:yes stop_codon:yes gene_type:complete